MSPIILTLYLIINGHCSQEQVGIYIGKQYLLVVSDSVVIEGLPYRGPRIRDDSYTYYLKQDTVLALRTQTDKSIYIQIQRFKIKDYKVIPIDAVILTSTKCR